jgi:hypothetical protein
MTKPRRTNRKSLILGENLSCGELARLCGVTSSAIRKRVKRGLYENTRDENDKRGFTSRGKSHRININDPGISEDVRNRWKRIQEQTFGLVARRDDLILEELQKINTLLKFVLERVTKDE